MRPGGRPFLPPAAPGLSKAGPVSVDVSTRRGPSGALLTASVLLAAVLLGGCFGSSEAVVPDAFLVAGWEQVDSGGGGSWLGEGARWTYVTYAVDPDAGASGPYPAYLSVLSIDTPQRLDREEVRENLETQVKEDAEEQNVGIDEDSRKSGERNLKSGVRTIWFTYEAEIEGGASLFDSGHKARVVGEVWFDERARITVVVVGLAQVEGSGLIRTYENHEHWVRIIMDPSGGVEGEARGDDGLIYNIRSNGS